MLAAGSTVPLSAIAYGITAERPVELCAQSHKLAVGFEG